MIDLCLKENGRIAALKNECFSVPFTPDAYGFFIETDGEKTDVELTAKTGMAVYAGSVENLLFSLEYGRYEDYLAIDLRIENTGGDFGGRIGFHTGVDTCMVSWPQWHDVFFPTLLRCEKTHLWGYFMNTAENALAIATDGPVASYDLRYNYAQYGEGDGGHRIHGADILFYQNTVLPARHPQHLRVMKA